MALGNVVFHCQGYSTVIQGCNASRALSTPVIGGQLFGHDILPRSRLICPVQVLRMSDPGAFEQSRADQVRGVQSCSYTAGRIPVYTVACTGIASMLLLSSMGAA